jgi:hypothetical protein
MRAAALFAVAGCSFAPGRLGEPLGGERDAASDVEDAASHDAVVDGGTDAGFDPATCPASYTITITGSSSRYRATSSETAFAASHATCNADLPDATHLVSFESATELDDLRVYLVPRTIAPSRKYYIGAVQMRDQPAAEVGWLVYSGMPLPPNQWAAGQPEDAGGGEDNQQNLATLYIDSGLNDSTGNILYGALCECDGMPIPASVLALIP